MKKNTVVKIGCVLAAGIAVAKIAKERKENKEKTGVFKNTYLCECVYEHDNQIEAERFIQRKLFEMLGRQGTITNFRCVSAEKVPEDSLFPDEYAFKFGFNIKGNFAQEELDELLKKYYVCPVKYT